jgi:hypothetical protein
MTLSRRLPYSLSAFVSVVLALNVIAAEKLLAAPDALQTLYMQNAAEIDAIIKAVFDKSLPVDKRVDAFQTLRINYPRAALDPAVKLVVDEQTPLALEGVQFLSAAIVMMNHATAPIPNRTVGSAPERVDHDQLHAGDKTISKALAALRLALRDGRLEIREVAAASLASFNDESGLKILQQAYQSKKIPDTEAVKYFTLARPSTGARYVEEILEGGSVAAQSEAISYLSPLDKYQGRIRENYLINEKAPLPLRVAAAKALSKNDVKFGSYAPKLVSNPELPTQVFDGLVSDVNLNPRLEEKTVQEIFSKAIASKPNTEKTLSLSKSLERLEASRPELDVSGLQTSLRRYSPI